MGVIQVKLSDENHKKLNILCVVYGKTQDEIINMLLERARTPIQLDFLIADESEVEMMKTEMKPIDTKIDPLIADEKKEK